MPRGKLTKERASAMSKGKTSRALERQERISAAEQELYESSLSVLVDASQFGNIDPNLTDQPPPDWVERLGTEEAAKRMALCRAAWLPNKDAPSGLQIAKYVVGAFAKARAAATQPRALNVTLIQMVGPQVTYPELEIVEGAPE